MSETLHFTVSPDFLNAQIERFIEEHEMSRAFDLALGCIGNTDIPIHELYGLATGLVLGTPRLICPDPTNPDVLGIEETGDTPRNINLFGNVADTQALQSKLNSMGDRIAYMYTFLQEREPSLLKSMCVQYYLDYGRALFPEEGSIVPAGVCEAVRNDYSSFAFEDEVSTPLADYLKTQEKLRENPDRPSYGWLNPDGNFIECEWGDHSDWAWGWIKENLDNDELAEVRDAGDALVARNWVLLHNPAHGTPRATVNQKGLTPPQKRFLADFYDQWEEPVAADAAEKNRLEDCDLFDIVDLR